MGPRLKELPSSYVGFVGSCAASERRGVGHAEGRVHGELLASPSELLASPSELLGLGATADGSEAAAGGGIGATGWLGVWPGPPQERTADMRCVMCLCSFEVLRLAGRHSRVLCGRCCSGERTSEGVSAGAGGEQRGGGARASSETVAAAAMQLEVDLDGVSVVLRVGAGQSVAEAVGGFMRSHGLEESMRGALLDAVAEVLRASLSTDERERESESESERGPASPSADAACTL
jgi:hypothetical protein